MIAILRSGWRIERRVEPTTSGWLIALTLAALVAITLCSLLLITAGASPIAAFVSLAKGGFGSGRALSNSLVKATPLIFTGLATALAFRARLWNIGAEGQVFAGAMFAYWCTHALGTTPALLQIPLIILTAMIGGALFGGLAGLLKTQFKVDEVISTVMLNYIIAFGLSMLLLKGPWSEAGGFFEQTAKIAIHAELPILFEKSRLHLGFLLALLAAGALHVMLAYTPLGYEIRAAGSNLRALAFQGTNTTRLVLVVMAVSGALAALAGVSEVYGVHHRLKAGVLVSYGYTGIVIAILGRLHPLGVVLSAIMFGGLISGSTLMQIKTGVPSTLVYAIQAIILICYLGAWSLASFTIRGHRPPVGPGPPAQGGASAPSGRHSHGGQAAHG
ncbi:MAG: ABC transporter permease [Geminicoccaceae bacterium]